ncbi:hypothetical protein NCER_101708 [Vairimorpha ceranae BRL01]|uniref:Threonyl-trna synthetase n=2 Tax=Vairimorpha ceranae TaxID=40302 RepID=C4VAL2_VAIC1|nr:threonyl-trna synthetase [Vairimorpha ceranae]EEQ81738.1 hypothetical protein NCER_101708 [Vairimorpha ceranae BRL01]KKO74972.1 threonyl-trna synthetase [Vairimorpha ceranae]
MLYIYFINMLLAEQHSQYTETPSDTIRYIPGATNEIVGVHGLKAVEDGIILRRSLDQGGIVYFLEDNKYPEWSFSYTITDINLNFPEEGGVYLWYTSHDQEPGEFRGGSGTFHGLMAGIEFKGASPELVFAFNNGENLDDKVHINLYRDSFSPDRLKGVKNLTVKIIVTKNNFKIELYNKDKILYDSMRLVSIQPHIILGTDNRFSLTSYYNYTSAEKAFKLIGAQLYKREEHENYDADKIHAENVSNTPMSPDDIMHPDKEMRHFIANFSHFMQYARSVLGETDDPSIRHYSNKIIEKIDSIAKKQDKSINNDLNQHINSRVNDMDIRIQGIQKDIFDILHLLKHSEQKKHTSISFTTLGLFVIGGGVLLILGLKEYNNWIHHGKKN